MADQKSNFIEIGDQLTLVDGPLSAALVAQLNERYQKEVDPETGIVLETLAIDSNNLASAWLAAQMQKDKEAALNKPMGFVYAVDSDQVSSTDTVELGDSLSDMTDYDKSNAVVYVQEGVSKKDNPYVASLLTVANKHKVKVIKDPAKLLHKLRKTKTVK